MLSRRSLFLAARGLLLASVLHSGALGLLSGRRGWHVGNQVAWRGHFGRRGRRLRAVGNRQGDLLEQRGPRHRRRAGLLARGTTYAGVLCKHQLFYWLAPAQLSAGLAGVQDLPDRRRRGERKHRAVLLPDFARLPAYWSRGSPAFVLLAGAFICLRRRWHVTAHLICETGRHGRCADRRLDVAGLHRILAGNHLHRRIALRRNALGWNKERYPCCPGTRQLPQPIRPI